MNNFIKLESFRNSNDQAFSSVKSFVNTIVDEFSFVETDAFLSSKPFLSDYEVTEGVLSGFATVDGAPIYLIAQNSNQIGGSLGRAGAEKICKCIDKALRAKAPLVSIIDSSGARVGEGTAVMEAYASILSAASAIAGVIPHICIVKGNAIGMQAAFCALADFVIAMPDAVYSVGTPMSILSKANDLKKPNEVLGATAMLKKGNVHFACKTEEECADYVKYLISFTGVGRDFSTTDDFNRRSPILDDDISVKNVLDAVCDDKNYRFLGNKDACVVCAIGYVADKSVGIILTKGELCLKGIQNATRFINFLDSFDIPLLTFVDSSTVSTGVDGELMGAAETVANLFYAVSSSDNAKIAVITGKAIGLSYTAFASKSCGYDYVYALINAVVSPVSGDLSVDVLYSDEIKNSTDPNAREKIAKRHEELSDVFTVAKEGYIDNVIEPSLVRPYVISALQMLD